MNAPKLTQVIRLDSLPLGQTSFTPEGYLRDRPILTSTGIFEYVNPDGSVRRELRLPEDVFAPESLASYKGKPLIITHDAGLVNKDNVHDNSIGTILSEGYRSDDDVRAEIIIHDTDAMRDCRFKELSLGYNLDLDETPGEWNGQHYDAIQRNIRINHLALVREARAGEQARLNIDGRDSEKTLKGGKVMNAKTNPKKARRADGVLSPEELEQAIAEYKAKRAAAEGAEVPAQDGEEETPAVVAENAPAAEETPAAEKQDEEEAVVAPSGEENIEKAVEEIKAANADCDGDMQKLFDIIDTLLAERAFDEAAQEEKPAVEGDGCGKCDEGEEVPAQDPAEGENEDSDDEEIPTTDVTEIKPGEVMNADSVDAIIRTRIQLGMMGKSLNLDGLESMNIADARKAVIKAVRPSLRLDGKSDAFIRAAYEMACDEVRSRNVKDTSYQKRQMFNKETRKDAADCGSSANAARERMIARQQNKNKEDK